MQVYENLYKDRTPRLFIYWTVSKLIYETQIRTQTPDTTQTLTRWYC